MKKSKGTTLIEIIISIVLISIVLIFAFNLLMDLKQENWQYVVSIKSTSDILCIIINKVHRLSNHCDIGEKPC